MTKQAKYYLAFLLIIFSLFAGWAAPVLASDITHAHYVGVIRATNNSTTATSVSVNISNLNSAQLIAQGLANATLTDVTIQNNSADVTFMPGYDTNPWVMYVDSIGTGSDDYSLYTSNVTGGKIRAFLDEDGMTVDDDATLEMSDNGSISITGRFDTSAASVGSNITSKESAVRMWVSGTGNVTAGIFDNTTPTSTTDSTANWTNDANAIDGNWATFAYDSIPALVWGQYLEMPHAAMWTENITFKCGGNPSAPQVDLDAYYGGAWNNVFEGAFVAATTYSKSIGSWQQVSNVRIRIWNNDGAGRDIFIYEITYDGYDAAVTAPVASGEKNPVVQMDSPFLSIAEGESTPIVPVSTGLTLNAPLWQTECSTSPFTSIDATGHTGTVVTATWTALGYDFPASGNITFPAGASWDFAGDFTIEGVFKLDNINRMIVKSVSSQDWATATAGDWVINVGGDNILRLYIKGGATAASTTTINTGTFYHFAVTRTGTALKLYTSGINTTAGEPTQAGVIGNTKALNIGQRQLSLDLGMDGVVGEIRIYQDDLSASQILQNYNATKSKYTTGDIYTYSTTSSVPDNDTDWMIAPYPAVVYMESCNMTKGGTLRGSYAWNYGATITDLSGNGNTGTPSFRTTSSDADVSALLLSFAPVTEAQSTSTTVVEVTTVFTTNASAPAQLFTDSNYTYIPGSEPINEILDASGTPRALWWFPLLFISVAIIGMLVYQATYNKGQATGSLLTMAIVMDVLLALLGIMNPIMLWPAILFWIPAGALILSQKHYGWG